MKETRMIPRHDEVRTTVRQVVKSLLQSRAFSDLWYLPDTSSSGTDALYIYFIVKDDAEVPFARKREIEARFREAFQATSPDLEVYFHWRLEGEQRTLKDQPSGLSLLH